MSLGRKVGHSGQRCHLLSCMCSACLPCHAVPALLRCVLSTCQAPANLSSNVHPSEQRQRQLILSSSLLHPPQWLCQLQHPWWEERRMAIVRMRTHMRMAACMATTATCTPATPATVTMGWHRRLPPSLPSRRAQAMAALEAEAGGRSGCRARALCSCAACV